MSRPELSGRSAPPASEVLREIADYLGDTNGFDTYGEGEYLQAFEQELADTFNKEAAVFMPSGTMAQQIALRIWCDRAHNHTIAMHPTAHPEGAESLGYEHLHNLKRLQFGLGEPTAHRVLTVEDFEQLGSIPAAALLELPSRPIGGQLPSWEELVAISDWAAANKVKMHMDGARIWQCRPHFNKSFAEISALFDSVYVSFYKDIGGMFGCMLMGEASFIKEARVWQRRHGGNLINQGAAVVSSKMGLERVLPEIDNWVAKAKELAEIFNNIDGVRTNPTVPQSSMFQLYVDGDLDTLNRQTKVAAEQIGAIVFNRLSPSAVPNMGFTEFHVQEGAMAFDVDLIKPFMEIVLKR